MAAPSRTDALQAALHAELEARRAELDSAQPLSSVTLIVRLADTGRPLDVVFRTEGRRELQPLCRRR